MSLDPSKLVAISYPSAIELCRQLNGAAISDDLLCRGGWPGPVAIALARLMHAGVGGTKTVEELRQCGFAGSDAILVAAQIATAGAR